MSIPYLIGLFLTLEDRLRVTFVPVGKESALEILNSPSGVFSVVSGTLVVEDASWAG